MPIHQVNRADIISIHAPARGATLHLNAYRHKIHYFNPRPREGGDRT